jgi:hypothetical protein
MSPAVDSKFTRLRCLFQNFLRFSSLPMHTTAIDLRRDDKFVWHSLKFLKSEEYSKSSHYKELIEAL